MIDHQFVFAAITAKDGTAGGSHTSEAGAVSGKDRLVKGGAGGVAVSCARLPGVGFSLAKN
jgi:hypothetical protein